MMFNLVGRPALVVGGGRVALRKARTLSDAGAKVRVVAPELLPELAADTRLDCVAAAYAAGHVAGMFLVIAATDDAAVNARVAADARAAGAIVNVVDTPALCDFIVPSVVERGRLVIAASTGGAAPSLARKIRERLEREFGPEYAVYCDVMDDLRRDIQARGLSDDLRRRLFERLTEPDLIAAARDGAAALREKMIAAVAEILGEAK